MDWPPVTWEQHPWVPSVPPDLVSRRVRERHAGSYTSAVVPTIASLDVHLPTSVLTEAEDAAAEIARFDAELSSDIAPFATLLLRSESASSSQIENLTASAKAIALAEIGDGRSANAEQVVDNVNAMNAAVQLADQIDADAILQMHRVLMKHDTQETAGAWRQQQVWIGGTNYGPHQAAFVPPHHNLVVAAIDDLVEFANRVDLPALPHAALAHAQFETIHPFTDGNGRTGRALIHSMLRAKGLSRHVTIPVSAGLLSDVDEYFAALTAFRAGDAAPIVQRIVAASHTAIANSRQLVADLNDTRDRWRTAIRARADAAAWDLADLLLRQPVIDAAIVQDRLDVTSANAHRAIRQLEAADVLVEFSGRKRRRLWQAPEVISALNDFAARAGRRRSPHG